jgi:hypothetical protein
VSTDDIGQDLPSAHAKAQDRPGPSSPGTGDLPEPARRAAEAAYRNWRIGDDGEGRLHAALVAAAPLIRAEAEAQLAAIEALCREPSHVLLKGTDAGIEGTDYVRADAILAITGTGRDAHE